MLAVILAGDGPIGQAPHAFHATAISPRKLQLSPRLALFCSFFIAAGFLSFLVSPCLARTASATPTAAPSRLISRTRLPSRRPPPPPKLMPRAKTIPMRTSAKSTTTSHTSPTSPTSLSSLISLLCLTATTATMATPPGTGPLSTLSTPPSRPLQNSSRLVQCAPRADGEAMEPSLLPVFRERPSRHQQTVSVPLCARSWPCAAHPP